MFLILSEVISSQNVDTVNAIPSSQVVDKGIREG